MTEAQSRFRNVTGAEYEAWVAAYPRPLTEYLFPQFGLTFLAPKNTSGCQAFLDRVMAYHSAGVNPPGSFYVSTAFSEDWG